MHLKFAFQSLKVVLIIDFCSLSIAHQLVLYVISPYLRDLLITSLGAILKAYLIAGYLTKSTNIKVHNLLLLRPL